MPKKYKIRLKYLYASLSRSSQILKYVYLDFFNFESLTILKVFIKDF